MASMDIPPSQHPNAIAKMPLAAKKTFRDKFDNEWKPDYEKQISDLLGTPWSIHVDYAKLFTYAHTDSDREDFARIVHLYFYYNIPNLKEFVNVYAADGVVSLNKLAHSYTVTLEPAEPSGWKLASCAIRDGRLAILFDKDNFGSNPDLAFKNLGDVVSQAGDNGPDVGASGFSLQIRTGIRDQYDTAISEQLEQTRKLLNCPDFAFEPNFEPNAAILSAWTGARKDWQEEFGRSTLRYFKNLSEFLRKNGFEKDDMLQEGFVEAASKKTATVKIIDDDKAGGVKGGKPFIEDGTLVFGTKKSYFGANVDTTTEGLLDLL